MYGNTTPGSFRETTLSTDSDWVGHVSALPSSDPSVTTDDGSHVGVRQLFLFLSCKIFDSCDRLVWCGSLRPLVHLVEYTPLT